ncbi:hypothetical protein [Nonomuraea salmonea]|uniref:hypothetical protein n=1 Tax=Nonomuraea salmonea TaxID=46181 RepID=UPI002FEAC766
MYHWYVTTAKSTSSRSHPVFSESTAPVQKTVQNSPFMTATSRATSALPRPFRNHHVNQHVHPAAATTTTRVLTSCPGAALNGAMRQMGTSVARRTAEAYLRPYPSSSPSAKPHPP